MNFDIDKIKRKMLVKYPFFGSVIANVDYKENNKIQTAGTDGKVIYYNAEFLESLSVSEQTFIFAHEVCHIAFNHILRSEGKDASVWNIATDAVINAFLKKDGLTISEGGVDIEEALNYDAEELYEKLLQEKQHQQQSQENQFQQQNEQQGQQGQSQQNQSGQGASGQQNQQEKSQGSEAQSNGDFSSDSESQEKKNDNSSASRDLSSQEETQDVGHDSHSLWEDAVKKQKEEQAEKTNKGNLLDKLFNSDKEKSQNQNEIEKKQEEIETLGEKKAFKKNLEEKKKELEKLKQLLSNQAMGHGLETHEHVRNITDIGRAKPLIDWRYVLREAIKYDVDWSYKNATIEDGIVSANLEEQPHPETEIVLDTSGSINETLLKNFLKECKNILQHSRLKVGCFDTKFYGFHEIRTEEDIENMEFIGGGGTDFDVAVEAFSRRVENKIVFTDGEAYMPKLPLDAIWIVFGGRKINPKGGKVIQITDEQLARLYSYKTNAKSNGKTR